MNLPPGPDPAGPRYVPVLIVGGGGAGLTSSLALSDLGIDSLLVERHPSTSVQPKAHILNARTMEIFAHHQVAADIRYAQATNLSLAWSEYFQRRMNHAHKRYLSALKTLTDVRKLGITVQLNLARKQVNVAAGS